MKRGATSAIMFICDGKKAFICLMKNRDELKKERNWKA